LLSYKGRNTESNGVKLNNDQRSNYDRCKLQTIIITGTGIHARLW